MYTLHTILSCFARTLLRHSNFLDAQKPSYFSADFMVFRNRYEIVSKWCQKSKTGSFMCIAFQFVAPLKGHILPNLSLKRRGCLWPTKRDPYHWLRQSLKRPRSACVFWSRLRISHDFLVALFAIWRASHASDRKNGGRKSLQIFVQDLILYQGQPLIYIIWVSWAPVLRSGGKRVARVCQQKREWLSACWCNHTTALTARDICTLRRKAFTPHGFSTHSCNAHT